MPRLPLLLCLALALVGRAGGSSVIAPEFDDLVNQAGYVVRAVVVSATPEWRENPAQPGQRYIATRVELEVREVIKGSPPRPLVLSTVGGRIGDAELRIAGSPEFVVGTEAVYFLHAGDTMVSPIVALMYGAYPVRRDPRTGREVMLRANGRMLYSERDVSLPLAQPSPEILRNPRARPLTAAQFAARIRHSVDLAARAQQN